jgi:hypothetical protein
MPYMNERGAEADNHESMKAFVDIMLSDEEKDECEANSGSDSDLDENAADSCVYEEPAPSGYEDELMAEAMHAILPGDNDFCDDDEFNLSFDETEELPENVPAPGTLHSVASRAMDKSSGPEAVLSSNSYNFTGDIEEGPLGVHIVSAHAELVDDESSKGDDSVNDRRAWRKKVMCMLSTMFFILVIICITVPTVLIKQRNQQSITNIYVDEEEGGKKGRPFQTPPGLGPFQGDGQGDGSISTGIQDDSGDGSLATEDLYNDDIYAFSNTEPIDITANLTEARSGTITNIFSDGHMLRNADLSFVPEDFVLNIGEVAFKCSQVPPLL